MATLTQLATSNLALKGAGDEYNYINRFFATKAEADAALADGSWAPEAGKLNGCLTGDQGFLVYNEGTSSLDLADEATRAYIDSQIGALVGDAPGVLDTLGEISDALNDNPNYFTDAAAATAANTALINTETSRATAAENAIQADVDQNEADADAAIAAETARVDALIASGMWLFADQSAFPPAADNHGRVVHSHADGAIFYAHGGMWHKIENEAEAEAARAAIQADVDQNESDADAADAALSDRLDVLEADPTTAAAVAAVQADVDQNESDSDAADAALGARIDAVESEIDTARTNIYTALGQAEGATTMGTFTGSTLGDGQTIKALLQQLETATETEISDRQAAIADILDGATFTGDILFGALARIKESGNELKIQNDAQSSSIVLGPKISLQPATGSRIELHETVRMPDGTDLTVTGAELNFVDGVTSNIQTQLNAIQADVDQNESDADAADTALSDRLDVLEADPVTKTYVDTEVANLIDAAPGALDTLNELAASIGDDANFAATVTNQIAVVQADVDQNESDSDAADAALGVRIDEILDGATFTGDIIVDEGSGPTIKLETSQNGNAGIVMNGASGTYAYIDTTAGFGNDSLQIYSANAWIRAINGGTGNLIVDGTLTLAGTALTATFEELNFVDGVTSNIQDQLDAIQADVNQNESDADAAISANEVHVDNLVSLSGVAKDQVHLSTFTGSTIVDNRTVKAALQDLETAVETKLNSSDVSTFGGTLVDDADAAAARTTLGLGSAATTDSGDYATAAQGATADAALPAAGAQAALSVDHLITLSGVAEAADDLGTFTGSTIDDNVTVKAALQALETAQETTQADVDQNESDADAAIAAILAGTSIPGPYNNDSDAATGGVAVGAIYKNSNGTIHWRVS